MTILTVYKHYIHIKSLISDVAIQVFNNFIKVFSSKRAVIIDDVT